MLSLHYAGRARRGRDGAYPPCRSGPTINEDLIGQTPTGPALEQSDLRALIATGVLITDANGNFIGFDPTVKALNGNSGAAHCPNA